MTATAAEALELALWLHRAPARRAALLGRPLPDGIGQLLRVATGARDQVAAAAMITGEDEATVLEAVRFYLQQILFHEGADDYRVLGLERGASHAQARDHHRLLQQWLHPDRSGNDTWETVYASRVNRAWGHLKTPQARATYDASVVPATAIGGRHGGEYQAVPTSVHAPVPRGNRSRNATLLVLLGCVGLLVLIAMRQDEPPEWRDLRPSLAAATSERKPDEIRAGLVETVGAAPVEAVAAVDAQARVETIEPSPVRDTPTAAPAPAPAHAPAHAPVVAVRPAATPMPVQAPAPGRPASPRPTASPVAVADSPPPRRPVPQPVVVRQAQTVAPSAAVPVAPILVAAVQQAGPPPPRAPAPASVPDAFDRMNQARRRADQVIAYLSDTAAASPAVWNDLRTLEHARQVRTALHDRHGGRTLPFELQAPKWHLAADGARLDAAYRIDQEQGRFGLDFTWREDQLLVRAMTLVPEA